MDRADLEAKITPRAKAIMAVDLWGRCGDMVWLSEFAAAPRIAGHRGRLTGRPHPFRRQVAALG